MDFLPCNYDNQRKKFAQVVIFNSNFIIQWRGFVSCSKNFHDLECRFMDFFPCNYENPRKNPIWGATCDQTFGERIFTFQLVNMKKRNYGTAVVEKSCWQARLDETSLEICKLNVIMVRQFFKKGFRRLVQVDLAFKYEK